MSPSTERGLTQLAVSRRCAGAVAEGAPEAGLELFNDNAPSFVCSRGRKDVANGGCRANQQRWTSGSLNPIFERLHNQRRARGGYRRLLKANMILATVDKP